MTIKDNKIRACPFCGGEAKLMQGNTNAWVICTTPGCGCEQTHDSAEQAIAAWNTRAQPSLQDTVGEDAVERAIELLEQTPIGDIASNRRPRRSWEENRDEVAAVVAGLRGLQLPPVQEAAYCGIVQVDDSFYDVPDGPKVALPVQEAGELVNAATGTARQLRAFWAQDAGTSIHLCAADLLDQTADRIQALEAENARMREATETRSVPTMDATWSAGWNCAMEFVRKAALKEVTQSGEGLP